MRFGKILPVMLGLAALAAQAANAGDVCPAACQQGLREAAGLIRTGDARTAISIWERWACGGSVDAAYNLAAVNQHGDGVPADPAAALEWYRRAAERGDIVSGYQIGLMYLNGESVAADPQETHRWFTAQRRHHMHHVHSQQMQAWRQQASALIERRDRREMLVRNREGANAVIADLRRRAGLVEPAQVASR